MDKISIIGLGKLGSCIATCFAYKGYEVIGVDINREFVDAINNGRSPVYEPKLQEFINASRDRLKATQNYEEAIKQSDITFLIAAGPLPGAQLGPGGYGAVVFAQSFINYLMLPVEYGFEL